MAYDLEVFEDLFNAYAEMRLLGQAEAVVRSCGEWNEGSCRGMGPTSISILQR